MTAPPIVRKYLLGLRLAQARRAAEVAKQDWDSAVKRLRAVELEAQRERQREDVKSWSD